MHDFAMCDWRCNIRDARCKISQSIIGIVQCTIMLHDFAMCDRQFTIHSARCTILQCVIVNELCAMRDARLCDARFSDARRALLLMADQPVSETREIRAVMERPGYTDTVDLSGLASMTEGFSLAGL